MALEKYCAACHHLSEEESYKKFYCYIKSQEIKATDERCSRFLDAGSSRNDDKRIQMFEASGGKYKPGCYLTTAMCEILGYPDDNYYLQTLRTFRDTVLKKDMKYIPLLIQYDIIGPQIATELIHDKNREIIAKTLFDKYITKAITAIEHQKTAEAVSIYIAMTNTLANRYHISTHTTTIYPKTIDLSKLDMDTLGHGRARKRIFQKPTIEVTNK